MTSARDIGEDDHTRWLSRFHSDERQVSAYRVGRVLLAGDAPRTSTRRPAARA